MTRRKYFSVVIMTLFLWPLSGSVSAEDLSDVQVLSGKAELVAISIIGPPKAEQRKNTEVTLIVENQGDVASGSYKVSIYLTKDKTVTPAGNDRLLGDEFYPEGLEPGERREAKVKVVIPNSGLEGTYYFAMRVKLFSVKYSDVVSEDKVLLTRFEKSKNELTVTDHKTGLMWQQSDYGILKPWKQAVEYCRSLDFGGYKDWRLPRDSEMMGLWGTAGPPAIRTFAIDPIFSCQKGFYWSSTWVGVPDGDAAMLVKYYIENFGGRNRSGWKRFNNFVRCVRSGS